MYRIEYKARAARNLADVSSEADRTAIVRRIEEIQSDPYRTRALIYGFEPYRRAKAGGRYRIFFKVDENEAVVSIAYIGARIPGSPADAYAVFESLLLEGRL